MSTLTLRKTVFPAVDPLAVFAAAGSQEFRCLWSQPDQNSTLVGVGSAVAWEACSAGELSAPGGENLGDERFIQAKKFMSDLDFEGPAPIALGGFAFAPSQGTQSHGQQIWNGFPNAKLVIPKLLFIFHHSEAREGQDAATRLNSPVEYVEVLTAQAQPIASAQAQATTETPTQPSETPQNQAITQRQTTTQHQAIHAAGAMASRQDFNAQATDNYLKYLADAITTVENGQLQKVVTARVISQQCHASPENVLGKLAQTAGANAVFAFGNSSHTFMGATPELLLRKQNTKVTSLALAGSERPGQTGSLLEDPKELSEHQMVVDHIRQRLVEAGVSVDPLTSPEPLDLKTIVHLATPISGACRDKTALDLVAQLHPSPSIGGLPTSEALRFISRHEKLDRGWYAGPVGWVTPCGDGTFFVALRSLLLDWLNRVSYCFAGSGIVKGSSLEKENQETLLKLQTALLSVEQTPIEQ